MKRINLSLAILLCIILCVKKGRGSTGRECAQAPERLAGEERPTRSVDVGVLVLGELMTFKFTTDGATVEDMLSTLTFAGDFDFAASHINDFL